MGPHGVAGPGEIGCLNEQARVSAHLRRAEEKACQRPPSGLCRARRAARRLLLRELGRYRAIGRFPQNRFFREPTPFFVDDNGTPCAVAHLLEASGEAELVQRIARERNNARVSELMDEPRLLAWLDAAGLTLEEAAMIQPSYCGDHGNCYCNDRAKGYLEAVVTERDNPAGTRTATIHAIYGDVDRGLSVGSEVKTSLLAEVDVDVVLRGAYDYQLDDGTKVYAGVSFQNGRTACDWGPSLTRSQYLEAVLSDDCPRYIAEHDDGCDEGCGCRAASHGGPTSLGILMALLGVVVARRARGRR